MRSRWLIFRRRDCLGGKSEDNQRFIHARYGLGDLLRPFKEQIEANICPDPMASDEEFSIAKARKAISEYRKAADDPVGTLDLMIYFVECGTRCTLEYGDIWEEYYDSLESMFAKAVTNLVSGGSVLINVSRLGASRDCFFARMGRRNTSKI